MIDLVEEAAEDRTFEELVDSVVEGRLSSAIYGEAKTIYPLRRVEIQKATLEAHPDEVAEEEETSVDVTKKKPKSNRRRFAFRFLKPDRRETSLTFL